MRVPFMHTAVVVLTPPADATAPGAAVTRELCGSWEHDPPCPLAAHQTDPVDVRGDRVRLRILFATEPAHEAEVRDRIEVALASGVVDAPDGETHRWTLIGATPGVVEPDEAEAGARLA